MVKKYTLTVSDEEGTRIDRWKDAFNLSAVFREAIFEKIEAKERFERTIKEDVDMELVVERLKIEKAEAEGDYFEKGKLAGLHWVQSASYQDLTYFDNWSPENNHFGVDLNALCSDVVLGSYFVDELHKDSLMKPGEQDEWLNDVAQKWLNGWLEGAQTFWKKIKVQL